MTIFLVLLAATFFCMHLICESLNIFVKYNFAASSKFMQGLSYSNYFAIVSRVFIALFGLIISYVIETGDGVYHIYVRSMIGVLLFAGFISYFLSICEINEKWNDRKNKYELLSKLKNIDISLPPVSNYESIFFGIQFAAIAVAYGVSFGYPVYRLTIISTIPLISMIGTFVSLVLVEPKYAKIIDERPTAACHVSAILLKARSKSFCFTFVLMAGAYFINGN